MVLRRRPVHSNGDVYPGAAAGRPRPRRCWRIAVLVTLLLQIGATAARAATEEPDAGRTPPRLSFMNGDVSFWRPGAEDWAPAHLNIPLAPGDTLYAGPSANLELQVGPAAFVRAGEETQVGVENQEPGFLQLKVTSGHAALDARELVPGQSIEIDTPTAAFTVDAPGYFRIDVGEDATTFIARRGGRARVMPTGGEATAVEPDEQVRVEGTEEPRVAAAAAPDLDDWDRWNTDRTDHVLNADSSRYVPRGVYGAEDLDRYGTWRPTPRYGRVWVPSAEPAGWAPYSTGRWIYDPFYGWTWVDDAPWGWAPYHYGRWVYTDGFWGWTPGPVVVAPVYAPALVAFFGFPGVHVGIGFGTPGVGWVALGFGEPCVPWWGHAGFVGHPWWGGWGGPRVVNNTVINNTTIVNVNNINVYQNAHVPHAVVAVRGDHFGRAAVQQARVAQIDAHRLQPVHGRLPVNPSAQSLVPVTGPARRPPGAVANRAVVATRAPRDPQAQLHAAGLRPTTSAVSAAPVRLVGSHPQAGHAAGRDAAAVPPHGDGAPSRLAHTGVPGRPNPLERGRNATELGRAVGPQSSTQPPALDPAHRPPAAAGMRAPARASASRFTPPPPPSGAHARGDATAAPGASVREPARAAGSRFAPPPPPDARARRAAAAAPAAPGPRGVPSAQAARPPAPGSPERFAAPGNAAARRPAPPPPARSDPAGERGRREPLSAAAPSHVQAPPRMDAPRRAAAAPPAANVARGAAPRLPDGGRAAAPSWPARPNTGERPRPQPAPSFREARPPAAQPDVRAAAPRPQVYRAPNYPNARMSAPPRQPAAPAVHGGGGDGRSNKHDR
jgi:uncharacterized protein DUF6600